MLISSFRYTRGLDLDARAYAEVTGIAVGWLFDERKIFRCGCWVCEFVVELECRGKDPLLVETATIAEFEGLLTRYGCLHWNKYLRYRDGVENPGEEGPPPDFMLARHTLRKAEERATKSSAKVEEPIWELEDTTADLPEDPDEDPSEELAFAPLGDVELDACKDS